MTRKRYPEIAHDLRKRILTGELTPGARLPSQPELMTTYGASLMTIRRAVDVLVREELVETRDKSGVYVRSLHRYRLEVTRSGPAGFSPSYPSLAAKLLAELEAPDRPLSQTVEIRHVEPPSGIAERLRLAPGQTTVLRHQVFYAGGDSVSFANAYFPAGMVAGTAIDQPEPLDNVFGILDDLGLNPAELVNEMLIRNATTAECDEMHWPESMYVLVQMCTTYTAAGVPAYCWASVLPGDRWILAERQYRDEPAGMRAVC